MQRLPFQTVPPGHFLSFAECTHLPPRRTLPLGHFFLCTLPLMQRLPFQAIPAGHTAFKSLTHRSPFQCLPFGHLAAPLKMQRCPFQRISSGHDGALRMHRRLAESHTYAPLQLASFFTQRAPFQYLFLGHLTPFMTQVSPSQ